jgi:hypothetical protein
VGTDPVQWSYGLGLGVRVPLPGPFFADVDALLLSQHAGTWDWSTFGIGNLLPTLHAVAGWKVLGSLAVTAGIDVDFYVPGFSRYPAGWTVGEVRLAPRFAVGLGL